MHLYLLRSDLLCCEMVLVSGMVVGGAGSVGRTADLGLLFS